VGVQARQQGANHPKRRGEQSSACEGRKCACALLEPPQAHWFAGAIGRRIAPESGLRPAGRLRGLPLGSIVVRNGVKEGQLVGPEALQTEAVAAYRGWLLGHHCPLLIRGLWVRVPRGLPKPQVRRHMPSDRTPSAHALATLFAVRVSCGGLLTKTAPSGPNARRHRRSGRLPSAPLRSWRVPWLGAHVPTGCRVEDSTTRHQRSTPCPPQPLAGSGRLPALPDDRTRPSDHGSPHRPASNHGEMRSGPARVKGACGVASDRASSTLDPHRSEPEVCSYRGDAED
jgi:hypothetical protein